MKRNINRVVREWVGYKFSYPQDYDEVGHFFEPTVQVMAK